LDFGADDEEGCTEREDVKTLEIHIGAIHDVKRSSLRQNLVEHVDVVHCAVRDADKRWDIATQVQQGVHLDSGLVLAKPGPREHRKTQVNGRRVERVKIVIQFETDRIFGVKGASHADQIVCEVGKDAPVVLFVSIGQRRPRDLAAKSQMIQLTLHSPQTSFDVSQAFTISELGECHRQILIPTRKTSAMVVTIVTSYTFLEFFVRQMRDQFRKHEAAGVHPSLCIRGTPGSPGTGFPCFNSNRSRPNFTLFYSC
jgi:hypothetical protein